MIFEEISGLFVNFAALADWRYWVMWAIGGLLIYLAIAKDMEPTLLLPLGFGTILVNIPLSGAIDQAVNGGVQEGALSTLFNAGIANELFPLILFIGIGAMIDFGPLLTNPKLLIFGAAAQFGIFLTFCVASMFFGTNDAASIAVIGAAGISAFPMSGRVVHKMALAEDPQNYLLMQAIGVNVSGQIASVVAGGLILNFFL